MALRALFIYLQWYPCICLTFLLLDPKNIPRRSDSCQNYYIESLWCFQISYKTKKKLIGCWFGIYFMNPCCFLIFLSSCTDVFLLSCYVILLMGLLFLKCIFYSLLKIKNIFSLQAPMFSDPSEFHNFIVITANPFGRSFLEMMNLEWHVVSWSAFFLLWLGIQV